MDVAYSYVYYCDQNKLKDHESKIDNFIERMQQPIISHQLEEEFKNIIIEQAIRYSKAGFANTKS